MSVKVTKWTSQPPRDNPPYDIPEEPCLKKNQNAPRPSEHPPCDDRTVREKMSKRLGGIIGCNKTSSWHLNAYGSKIGSTVQCRGEAHRYTVHLLFKE